MNLMKKLVTSILTVAIIASFGVTSIFATTTDVAGPTSRWSYSNYSHGSYVPKSGYLATRFFDSTTIRDYAKTYVQIKLDSHNVTNILDYNNGGDNPGTAADNKKVYLTCDVSSIRTGSDDMMDAYSVSSTLPNPKTDIENDDWFGNRNEESEVVALGTVSAKEYNMITWWDDYRSGGSTDNGRWQCQFSMSEKGWSDYNNVIQSDVIQATVNYGKTSGKP